MSRPHVQQVHVGDGAKASRQGRGVKGPKKRERVSEGEEKGPRRQRQRLGRRGRECESVFTLVALVLLGVSGVRA